MTTHVCPTLFSLQIRRFYRYNSLIQADRVIAACAHRGSMSRKVRAPQGTVLANGQAGRPDGKCNREVYCSVAVAE